MCFAYRYYLYQIEAKQKRDPYLEEHLQTWLDRGIDPMMRPTRSSTRWRTESTGYHKLTVGCWRGLGAIHLTRPASLLYCVYRVKCEGKGNEPGFERTQKLVEGVAGAGVKKNQRANGTGMRWWFAGKWGQIREIRGLGLASNGRSKDVWMTPMKEEIIDGPSFEAV